MNSDLEHVWMNGNSSRHVIEGNSNALIHNEDFILLVDAPLKPRMIAPIVCEGDLNSPGEAYDSPIICSLI